MDRSHVTIDRQDNEATNAAMLTLTRGASGRASWGFQRGEAGQRITLGSNPNCDWQIAASGVSEIVMFFSGEELWLGAERANRLVILNDATAELGWTRLRHGDRLELSGARIQVALAPDLRTARPTLAMEAPAHRPSAPSLPVVENPSAAIVRLVRGHSDRFAWVFRANDLGASVSIGAGRHCDWPMGTGGFEISEVTLLFAGGVLLARREHPGDRLRLNGAPLGDDWTFISSGSRIDIGLACVEVQLSTDHASLSPLPPGMRLSRGSSPQIGPSPNAHHGARPTASPANDIPLDQTSQRAELVLRTGAGLARVPNGPTQRTQERSSSARPRRHAVETSRESMEAMRPPEAWVQACVPATRRARRSKLKLTSYALCGLLLAVFYVGWLVLLERI